MIDPEKMIRPDIARMKAYTPILPFEVLSQKLGRDPDEIVKLDANENPYGPAPGALAALQNGRFFHIYPDPESRDLRHAIHQFTQTPIDHIMTGMGADELIDLALRVVLSPGDGVIDCPPSFGMYPFSTAVNGGKYIAVPRRSDFSLDVEGIEAAVSTHPNIKVLFLCSPNNPNGSVIDDAVLRRLLALPVLVVLDEAYIDFAAVNGRTSHFPWVTQYDNLVVLRTFSKLAGLAGLRVGFGAAPHWLLQQIWKIKQPYNVNVAANLAALAALEDTEWLHEKVSLIVSERQRLFDELGKISYLTPYPSESNFILCKVSATAAVSSAKTLKQRLEEEGILVRYFNKPRLADCIRISVGRPEQNDSLLAALKRYHDTNCQL